VSVGFYPANRRGVARADSPCVTPQASSAVRAARTSTAPDGPAFLSSISDPRDRRPPLRLRHEQSDGLEP